MPIHSNSPPAHDTFCIAASAGGMNAIPEVLRGLDDQFPGSIFITQHISSKPRRCYLADLFARETTLECRVVTEECCISPGVAYIASPGMHLIIGQQSVYPSMGPKENFSRPAADPMFRSAAVHHGSSSVGIVLTGYLDDGTAGLASIKQCGGKAIVQDPETAVAPEMPRSAIQYCGVDRVLPIHEIANEMWRLSETEPGPSYEPSEAVLEELKFATSVKSDIAAEQRLGTLSPFMCPDCNGQMWRLDKSPQPRFRCHVGHAHSLQSLQTSHDDVIERQGWSLMRTLRERERLLNEMADHEDMAERREAANDFRERANQCGEQADAVREALQLGDLEMPPPDAGSRRRRSEERSPSAVR